MGKTKTFGDIDIECLALVTMLQPLSFTSPPLDEGWQCFCQRWQIRARRDRLAGITGDADEASDRVQHDVEILRAGSYAWRLKQRSLSDLGHLLMKVMPWSGPGKSHQRRFIWGICHQKRTISKHYPYDHGESTGSSRSSCQDFEVLIHHQMPRPFRRRYKIEKSNCYLISLNIDVGLFFFFVEKVRRMYCVKGEVNACLFLRLVFISLGLGIIGIPTILPTTPFYCCRWLAFAKVPNALKLGFTKLSFIKLM